MLGLLLPFPSGGRWRVAPDEGFGLMGAGPHPLPLSRRRGDECSRMTTVIRMSRQLLLLALLFSAGPLHAQNQPPADIPVQTLPNPEDSAPEEAVADPVQLETVVVSGEKLGRKLSETATSTAVIRARDVEAQGDGKLQEAVAHAANVVRAQSDRQIAIRGVLQNGIAGEGETITVVVDGVALPQRAANFGGPLGVFDVEQIEVLRGAQSTTQGRNSLAGAVVVRTRDPQQAWDGKVRHERASLDGQSLAFAGGGALIPGWLAARVSHEDRYFRNDIVNTTRRENDAGREDTATTRFKLLLTPPGLSGYRGLLTLAHANNEFGDNIHDSTAGERRETANERYTETYDGNVWSLQQSYALDGGLKLDAISGYAPGHDWRFADFDRTEVEGGSAIYDYDEDNRSQELRFTFTPRSTLRGLVGVYAARIHQYAYNETVDPIPVGGGAALLSGYQFSDMTTDTIAGFGEFDWTFVPQLTLTAGLRYQIETSDRRQVSQLDLGLNGGAVGLPVAIPIPEAGSDLLGQLAPDTVPPDYDVTGATRFPVWLPKLGLAWQFTERDRLALTWQKGYRSGGTSVSFFGGTRSDYEPEFTQTLELALRSSFPSLRSKLNLNVFYTKWKDQQVTLGESTSFYTTTANAGRSHLYGAEVEINGKPFPEAFGGTLRGFEPFASLGLLKTQFDEFLNNCDDDGENCEDSAGNSFPYAAPLTGTLGANYRLRSFFAFAAATYNAAYYGQASNAEDSRVPAKTLVNARLGYQLDRIRLSLYGRNLTGDLNLQDRFTVGPESRRRTAKRYGEPRLFGVAVEVSL